MSRNPSRSPYGERGLKWRRRICGNGERCRSPYGERGLKCDYHWLVAGDLRRSPYGERGLKLFVHLFDSLRRESLSLRRAWIEIVVVCFLDLITRRSPYGERGLKYPTPGSSVRPW